MTSIVTPSFWHSQIYGRLELGEIVDRILAFMGEDRGSEYSVMIGSDSEVKNGAVEFITVIIIHRIGKGARYFMRRVIDRQGGKAMHARIFREVALSLETATAVGDELILRGIPEYLIKWPGIVDPEEPMGPRFLEVHLDVGRNGATKDMIQQVTGMIRGSGFTYRIKPEAYAASVVADRHI